jgi:hypothetical protein
MSRKATAAWGLLGELEPNGDPAPRDRTPASTPVPPHATRSRPFRSPHRGPRTADRHTHGRCAPCERGFVGGRKWVIRGALRRRRAGPRTSCRR